MQSHRRYRHASRNRSRHLNTPDAIKRRRAKADARREARAATLPPIPEDPAPLTLWQSITVELYVPTAGRCDQWAAVVNGERVGLLCATEIGRAVAKRVSKRPSYAERAELRAMEWRDA